MPRIFHETEHQELFYLQAPLREPLKLHIPSALGPLAYYVCLKVDPNSIAQLQGVSVHAKLEGLRNTDSRARQGDKVDGPRTYPSADGKVWFVLCRLPMARGDGEFRFFDVPASFPKTDILFCTWPRFIEHGHADAWIAGQNDPAWTLTGVPLGGIGAGRIDICRDGRFRNFSGNNNQDVPFEDSDGIDGAYLSISVGAEERVLSTRPIGGLGPCPRLEFEAAFPQAILRAPQALTGLDVQATLSGALSPHDLSTSSLPLAMIRWTLTNTSPARMSASCRFAWPNLVGQGGGLGEPERRTGYGDGYYRFWEAPEAHSAEPFSIGAVHGVRYANSPGTVCASADGHHLIAVRANSLQSGSGATTQARADPKRGSVGASLTLAPGESANIDMALVWEMPHWIDSLGVDRGMYWRNQFPDGKAILSHVFENFDALLKGTGSLAAHMSNTTLATWIWRRLCNSCYPLVTNSVLYPDGRFSINEGPTEMSGVYGTIDQRLGAHAATQLLFPQLNKTELLLFSRIQDVDGAINHDLGSGHLERTPSGQKWPDIACSYAIQMARHAWTTGDAQFEKDAWPRVKHALEWHGKLADEGGGVAQLGHKTGLGTSYDSYHYEGTTAYIATLWIAALQIGKKWALRENDPAFAARADAWIARAIHRLDADLWNGRFYRAYAGVNGPTNENCHGGMLAGEWYARLLAGTDVLPGPRLEACAKALMEFQGNDRFPVPPDEVGPDGGTGSLYGWLPYIESFCVAPVAVLRQPKALAVWERMIRAMDGNGEHPCETRLMYRPQTGEPSWGAYYMTAPASWLVYEALLDFTFEPGTGTLRLLPQFTGHFPVIHPLFWALAGRDGTRTTLFVTRTFAKAVSVRHIQAPAGMKILVDGKSLAKTEGGPVYSTYRLQCPVDLEPGAVVAWDEAAE